MCSAPVGSSNGDAFSDEEFNSPGSKVTAIKIRVGGAALDYIQVGDAKKEHKNENTFFLYICFWDFETPVTCHPFWY